MSPLTRAIDYGPGCHVSCIDTQHWINEGVLHTQLGLYAVLLHMVTSRGAATHSLCRYTSMAEMAFSTLPFRTNIMDAPPKEDVKSLVGIRLITRPSFPDVKLQLSKKFLNGIEIR